MKFMVMHKVTDALEQGLMPEQSVIEGVGKLIEDALKQKIFVGGEGLKPTSQRVHVKYENGKRVVTEGPFRDAKELVGGFALLSVRSRDEALAVCDEFAATIRSAAEATGGRGDIELFLGPVVEEWDLTGAPRPVDAPHRFLSMHTVDERKPNAAPSPELMQKHSKSGVLQTTGGLGPTKQGARIRFNAKGKKHTVVDGPFAESKELVAGYAILDLPSKEAAVEWATRFGEVVQVNEVEVRRLEE